MHYSGMCTNQADATSVLGTCPNEVDENSALVICTNHVNEKGICPPTTQLMNTHLKYSQSHTQATDITQLPR